MQGNLALKMSMDLQTPVRVCRAASSRERNGTVFRMYSYAGLYIVKEMKRCGPQARGLPVAICSSVRGSLQQSPAVVQSQVH